MGRFTGLGGVRTNTGGVYFLDGLYVVDLLAHKCFFSLDKGCHVFVVEAEIVESSHPDRKPGTMAAQVVVLKRDKNMATRMSNLKQHAAALLGIDNPDTYVAEVDPKIPGDTPEQATDRFWDQALEAIVSDEQPGKGVRMRLQVTTIQTAGGNPFPKHLWSPMYEAHDTPASPDAEIPF